MEVILLQDVKTLGKEGDVVKVNDGYARNFILPKKLGIEATNKNINDLKLKQSNDERIQQELLEEAKEFAKKIEQKPVVVEIKAGEGGKTFGSISTKEIAAAVTDQFGFEIDKKKMNLSEQIKAIGTHIVSVKIHKDVTAKLTVKVEEMK
ncbi:MAG: 50S ribosomal protein L9 [Clostridiales bacterium]|nr:50S ribosomal protein L9 [Clostridiales bacterium]